MNDSDFSPMMFKFCLKLNFSRMFADVLDDAEYDDDLQTHHAHHETCTDERGGNVKLFLHQQNNQDRKQLSLGDMPAFKDYVTWRKKALRTKGYGTTRQGKASK